jgi:hypothetical protein
MRAPEAPQPFVPNTTYIRGQWQFRCLVVAARPMHDDVRAIGWLTRSHGTATAHDEPVANRSEWTEVDQ